MSDISEHDGSIRQLHFSDWLDGDFRKVLDMIEHWESTEELPIEPPDEVISLSLDELVEQAAQIFGDLDHDARVDALNALAVALEVMDPDDGETE